MTPTAQALAAAIEAARRSGPAPGTGFDADFVELAKELVANSVSVRHIAALTGRSKSAVHRAVNAHPPSAADPWAQLSAQVVHDAFCEASNALLGYYAAFCRDARSQVERELWEARMGALKAERDSVGVDDRETMARLAARWQAERAHLASLRRSGGAGAAPQAD
jgi:hypothetical protein